jgi:hypothetical protein
MNGLAEDLYDHFLAKHQLEPKSNYLYSQIFDQDQLWIDCQGQPHLLDSMSTEYLENVLSYINQRRITWNEQDQLIELKNTLLTTAIKHKLSLRKKSSLKQLFNNRLSNNSLIENNNKSKNSINY